MKIYGVTFLCAQKQNFFQMHDCSTKKKPNYLPLLLNLIKKTIIYY